MPSTREQILLTARRLFNERGYGQVTMRALASELSIGVGNVTYYFARKQDIVAALMDNSFEQTRMEGEIATLGQLMEMFSRMLDALTRDTFFFLDPEFSGDPRHARHHGYLRARLEAALDSLTAGGVFLPCFTPAIRQTVLSMLLMTHITWLRQTMRSASPMMDKRAFLRAHMTLLSPYLSEKGLLEWRALERADEERAVRSQTPRNPPA